MNAPAYLWVFVLFAVVTILISMLHGSAAALRAAGRPAHEIRTSVVRLGLLLAGWLGAVAVMGWFGLFRSTPQHASAFFPIATLAPIVIGVLVIRRAAWARMIVDAVPQSWLIGVQVYRGVGAIFLLLYGFNLLPGEFAFPAGFGDVAVALLALPVAALQTTSYVGRTPIAVAWNVLGLADLVIALTTGFLSSPGPLQLIALNEPNQLMSAFPMVLVPTFAVPLSIVLHIASLMKLAEQTKTRFANRAAGAVGAQR